MEPLTLSEQTSWNPSVRQQWNLLGHVSADLGRPVAGLKRSAVEANGKRTTSIEV